MLDRKLVLTVMVGLLRGIEGVMNTLGWDRVYLPPQKPRAIWTEGKPERVLAQYQKNQGRTNHCAVYSISAALRMLGEQAPPGQEPAGVRAVDYDGAVALSNSRAVLRSNVLGAARDLLAGDDLRLWAGGPVAPREQAMLARKLAQDYGIAVQAEAVRGTPDDLLRLLADPHTKVLVTFGWSGSDRPEIMHPDGKFRQFGKPDVVKIGGSTFELPFTAHVMLLAAYDPDRRGMKDGREIAAPWGFVNSWVDGGDGLYWMTEDDFRKAWRFVIPTVGRQKMVVLRRAANF